MTAFKLMDYSGVEYAALADMPTESSFTVIAKASGRASHYSVGSTLYDLSGSLKVERGQSYVFNLEQKTLVNSIVYDTNLTLKKCLKSKPFEQNNKKQCFGAGVLNNAINKKCFKQKGFDANHKKTCLRFGLKYNDVRKKSCFKQTNYFANLFKKSCFNIKSIEFDFKRQCVLYHNLFETASKKSCFNIFPSINVIKKRCFQYRNEFESITLKKCFHLPNFTDVRIKRCSEIKGFEEQSSNFIVEVINGFEQNADLEFLCLFEGQRDTYDLSFTDRLCRLLKFKYQPKVEFIMNTFKIIDVETNQELNALACDLSYSQDSLTWDIGLELAYNTDPLHHSVGRRLRIELNGFVWNIRVSSSSVSKQFAKTSINCQAESINYYERSSNVPLPAHSHPNNIAQLNLAHYTDVVDGWQVQTSGNDSLQAINKAIADSLGGVLLTNTDTGEQYVKPLTNHSVGTYRKISDNLVITHSAEYTPYAPANVALLTGGKKLYAVKKRDSANNVAISSNLPEFATNSQIVRKYAERVLSETNKYSMNRYTLPLNDATGLLIPAECVVLMDRYVVVNSLSVSVKWDSGLVVRQDIEATEYQIKGFKHNG